MIDIPLLRAMLEHWLDAEVNGYYGSNYGPDKARLMLNPLSDDVADDFIRKLKSDIPVFNMLNSEQLSIFTETNGFETRRVFIVLGGEPIEIGDSSKPQQITGGTFNVNAR